jgi:hypothetical protein
MSVHKWLVYPNCLSLLKFNLRREARIARLRYQTNVCGYIYGAFLFETKNLIYKLVSGRKLN